jgi:membrane-bound inhibitor of C-type lysozyme
MRSSAAPRLLAALLCAAAPLFGCSREEAPTARQGDVPAVASGNPGHDYRCDDGLAFHARMERGNAILRLGDETLTLTPTEGASGAHFSGGGVTFIALGEEALFLRAGEKTRHCAAK